MLSGVWFGRVSGLVDVAVSDVVPVLPLPLDNLLTCSAVSPLLPSLFGQLYSIRECSAFGPSGVSVWAWVDRVRVHCEMVTLSCVLLPLLLASVVFVGFRMLVYGVSSFLACPWVRACHGGARL